jgi:hypothetical protein
MVDKQELHNGKIYHIRVEGNLDEKWTDWFEGLAMTARDDGQTLLSGAVVDQAALHGVLAKIHRLGLPLLLVAQANCPCSSKNCLMRGQCCECVAHHSAKGQLSYCFRTRTRWDKQCAAFAGKR